MSLDLDLFRLGFLGLGDLELEHAILKGEGNYFTLKDISLSGTYVDGKKIEISRLKPNARIRMGKSEMVYHEKR